MGAADNDGVAPRKEKFLQYLRKRAIRNPPVEHFFKLGISAGDDVADHNKIGRGIEMRGIERGKERNAKTFQQRGSWGVHAGIGTGDAEAALAQHAGKRRHRRAANSDYVNVFAAAHGMTAGSSSSKVPAPCAIRRARTPKGMVRIGRRV